jgi:hypothetical protein
LHAHVRIANPGIACLRRARLLRAIHLDGRPDDAAVGFIVGAAQERAQAGREEYHDPQDPANPSASHGRPPGVLMGVILLSLALAAGVFGVIGWVLLRELGRGEGRAPAVQGRVAAAALGLAALAVGLVWLWFTLSP